MDKYRNAAIIEVLRSALQSSQETAKDYENNQTIVGLQMLAIYRGKCSAYKECLSILEREDNCPEDVKKMLE